MVDGYRAICLCLASVINSRCLSGVWEFYIYLKSSDAHEKNCNISCQPKILSSRTFVLLKLTEVTSTQESVQGFSYRQIPGDVISVNFNSKKGYEDEFFG